MRLQEKTFLYSLLMGIALLLTLNVVFLMSTPDKPSVTPPVVIRRHIPVVEHRPVVIPKRPRSPNNFVRLGHLESESGAETFRPLYGKQLGRDQWKYYALAGTQDTGMFPVAVLSEQNRNCLDHYGCRQLYDHDTVRVDQDSEPRTYQVKMYDRMFF
jgi:hypothetical protein